MRPRLTRILLTAAALVAVGAGAAAQPTPPPAVTSPPAATPPPEEESTVVDALVVNAVRPGPAFWKITQGRSTVWLMGVPAALPKGTAWKQDELKAHLRNAHVLIVGTGGFTLNIIDALGLILSGGAKKFKADRPLSQTLPPDLLARYEAARAGLKMPDRSEDNKPAFAAFGLSYWFKNKLNMDGGQPERTITRDAFLKVRTERVGRTEFIDIYKKINEMSPEAARICVEDAVRQVEAGPARELEAARGWTTGDLRVAISAERGMDRCLETDPQIRASTERTIGEVTAAILEALKKPGKSVAVADLQPMLTQNGILMRLMATPGVKVTAPDAPGLEDEIGAEAAEPEEETGPYSPGSLNRRFCGLAVGEVV